MKLTIVGCGDAFGSGGRLQTSYLVDWSGGRFLIDCGATTMIGLNRLEIDPNTIPAIFITHLHGDHFSGLVWWLLHAQHIAKRKTPLTIVGPEGIEARFLTAAEALFPGSAQVTRVYPLAFREFRQETPIEIEGVRVTPFEVQHASGAPPYALRFEMDGKVLAFTGDSEWIEPIVTAGRNADLYIMECYQFSGAPRFHMSWETISANLDRIGARKVVLTHMSAGMLARAVEIEDRRAILAEDGLAIVF